MLLVLKPYSRMVTRMRQRDSLEITCSIGLLIYCFILSTSKPVELFLVHMWAFSAYKQPCRNFVLFCNVDGSDLCRMCNCHTSYAYSAPVLKATQPWHANGGPALIDRFSSLCSYDSNTQFLHTRRHRQTGYNTPLPYRGRVIKMPCMKALISSAMKINLRTCSKKGVSPCML